MTDSPAPQPPQDPKADRPLPGGRVAIWRHPLWVRWAHWINVVAVVVSDVVDWGDHDITRIAHHTAAGEIARGGDGQDDRRHQCQQPAALIFCGLQSKKENWLESATCGGHHHGRCLWHRP